MRVLPSIQALSVRSCTTASIRPAASVFRIEAFAAESDAKFLGVLRVREAVDDPPLIFMKDAVMPFAHRKVEAEGIHESAERTSAFSRRDSDGQPRSSSPFLRPIELSPLTRCSS